LVKELKLHSILDRESVYMSRCGKAVNDGIGLGDLSSIVPLTDDFLGSANRAGGFHHYRRAGCSARCEQENKSCCKVKSIFHLITPFIIESLRGSYRASINHFS
jgi:hypothetical protein